MEEKRNVQETCLPDLDRAERVVCWFSCGAASAVATKLAIDAIGERLPVVVAYCASTLSAEHPDNLRFLQDFEQWFGQRVEMLYSDKYKDTWEVWNKTRWLVGPSGARCTLELKKTVRQKFERPTYDIQVFGFDSTEDKRASRFAANNPEARLWAPLLDGRVSKARCFEMLREAGIAAPAMYALGYRNNNCIGCVKGGQGYWNKIRVDFPDTFARMARLERTLNVAINKSYAGDGVRKRVFLDELPPYAGRYATEPSISCGVLCSGIEGLRQLGG